MTPYSTRLLLNHLTHCAAEDGGPRAGIERGFFGVPSAGSSRMSSGQNRANDRGRGQGLVPQVRGKSFME